MLASLLISSIIPFVDFSTLLPAREQVLMVILDPVVITPEGIQTSIEANSSIYEIGLAIYLTGIVIFGSRFLYQLIQLAVLIRRFRISRQEGMRIVFTDKNFAPFSFFNLVFINRRDINSPETQKIIAHERVHIRQWHSLDLMLLEFVTIIQWFNPFVWLYRHAIKTLHEYLADEGVLHSGVDAKVYSALLFEQGTGIQINDLTNNFSKSLLKRRFKMMTKKRTTRLARAKLLFALPLALSMMFVISFSPDMLAQEKEKVPAQPKKVEVVNQNVDPPPPQPKQVTVINIVEDPEQQDDPPIFTVVEDMPIFPGGKEALYKYLGENITYPAGAKKDGTSGTVYVSYVVEIDGRVSNVTLLRGVREDLDNEAIRVIKEMPKWTPGKQNGKAVRVQYNLPIKFSLNGDKKEEKKD
ncbi:MAG: hypothetical protein DRI83_07670 [Bacteroidetes bacterium]|nr:MAG: hypothetical protein DRI83_07670 [Bacteroidota bacterium]